MKQFTKLFSVLVVISLVALVPSQAQTVTLVINGLEQTAEPASGGVAVITVDMQGYERLTAEVVGGGDVGTGKVKLNHKGKVIEVAHQAVQAHLNHLDTLVGNAVEVVATDAAPGYMTLTVSGVTSNVTVKVTLFTI